MDNEHNGNGCLENGGWGCDSPIVRLVMEGKWDESVDAVKCLGGLSADKIADASLSIREQEFFELIHSARVTEAINMLRTNITPRCVDTHRLGQLAYALVSPHDCVVMEESKLNVSIPVSRQHLVKKIERVLYPPSTTTQIADNSQPPSNSDVENVVVDTYRTDNLTNGQRFFMEINFGGSLVRMHDEFYYINGQSEVHEYFPEYFTYHSLTRYLYSINVYNITDLWYLLPNLSLRDGMRRLDNQADVADMLSYWHRRNYTYLELYVAHGDGGNVENEEFNALGYQPSTDSDNDYYNLSD